MTASSSYNQVCLQDMLLNIQSDDFKSVRVVINPFGDREHGVWVSVFDLLEYVAKKKNPQEVFKRIENQHSEFAIRDKIQFLGQRGPKTPIIPLRKSVQLLQLTPGEAGQKVRTASAELLCRHVAGDESLIEEIQANRVEQERLSVEDPGNPMRLFAVDHKIRQNDDYPKIVISAASSSKSKLSQSPPPSKIKNATETLPEPVLRWIEDLGAKREEVPAAKASFRALLEIEIASGALPKATTAAAKYSITPPVHLRYLAEASLASIRDAVQKRLSTLAAAAGPPPCCGQSKRRRECQEEHDDKDIIVEVDDCKTILTVSEVMTKAEVWDPVRKPYMSDLSNRMLQIKCQNTDGSFSERISSFPFGLVHKYKKPEDLSVAHEALCSTKSLYEKRIRELLEDAFVRAGIFDDALAFACSEAARRLATQLLVDFDDTF
jgi:hypothetical protein